MHLYEYLAILRNSIQCWWKFNSILIFVIMRKLAFHYFLGDVLCFSPLKSSCDNCHQLNMFSVLSLPGYLVLKKWGNYNFKLHIQTSLKTPMFFKTHSASPFHGDFKNAITFEFSCRNDGEIRCWSGCKNLTFRWKKQK